MRIGKETMELTENKNRNQKFVIDKMYYKLARWLRILGYDTIAEQNMDEIDIIQLAKAENRIIISRDEDLVRRASKLKLQVVNPEGKEIEDRLLKLYELTKIDLTMPETLLSRCTLCNSAIEPIEQEKVDEQIPDGTKKHYNEYWLCTNPDCKQVFWKGSHWKRIEETLVKVQKKIAA